MRLMRQLYECDGAKTLSIALVGVVQGAMLLAGPEGVIKLVEFILLALILMSLARNYYRVALRNSHRNVEDDSDGTD